MNWLTRTKILILSAAVLLFISFTGCKENTTDPGNGEPTTDKEAYLLISDEDSSLASFDVNYNEEDVMEFLGKTETQFYPFKIEHRVALVSKTITYNVVGDTSYATLTKNYNGVLIISGSYDVGATYADTIIRKNFTASAVRNLIFVRTGNSNRPYRNWRLAAISLPNAGTTNHNDIIIQKLTVTLPNEIIIITNPNDFYIARGKGWWKEHPSVPKNSNVTINVELFSTSADTDFVTLTWGAEKDGLHRAKRKFILISSTPIGVGFLKVYEQTYTSNAKAGFFHAIINAFPRSVIFDDATAVQNNAWGFPYYVKNF